MLFPVREESLLPDGPLHGSPTRLLLPTTADPPHAVSSNSSAASRCPSGARTCMPHCAWPAASAAPVLGRSLSPRCPHTRSNYLNMWPSRHTAFQPPDRPSLPAVAQPTCQTAASLPACSYTVPLPDPSLGRSPSDAGRMLPSPPYTGSYPFPIPIPSSPGSTSRGMCSSSLTVCADSSGLPIPAPRWLRRFQADGCLSGDDLAEALADDHVQLVHDLPVEVLQSLAEHDAQRSARLSRSWSRQALDLLARLSSGALGSPTQPWQAVSSPGCSAAGEALSPVGCRLRGSGSEGAMCGVGMDGARRVWGWEVATKRGRAPGEEQLLGSDSVSSSCSTCDIGSEGGASMQPSSAARGKPMLALPPAALVGIGCEELSPKERDALLNKGSSSMLRATEILEHPPQPEMSVVGQQQPEADEGWGVWSRALRSLKWQWQAPQEPVGRVGHGKEECAAPVLQLSQIMMQPQLLCVAGFL